MKYMHTSIIGGRHPVRSLGNLSSVFASAGVTFWNHTLCVIR